MANPGGVEAALLAALAEPNRLRIVRLLAAAPRPVGEIALALGLRQPQVTKHLQTLERAGLVTVHPLGQRRIYSLEREPFRRLAEWASAFREVHPSEDLLERYQAAIEIEQADARTDPQWAVGRTLRFQRTVAARPTRTWRYWTDADLIRRWWSPEHFTVVECEAKPVPGGLLRIVMAEGDSMQHTAAGHYLALDRPRGLSFELAPLGPDGSPLFSAVHRVRLGAQPRGTTISLTIRIDDATPAAAPAIAGLRPGWKQLFDKLAHELAGRHSSPRSAQ
jgi:uncharacterized protein YndB with AHSA1/START domain/DNA-binding transcriptional ArsR family regulator